MKRVYFDHNAATPVHREVLDTLLPFLNDKFGNAQSFHALGQEARQSVDQARISVAKLIHASPDEIVFTSNGSEANNFALKGIAFARKEKGNHVVLSQIEHQSVLKAAESLTRHGFTLSHVPVDKYGKVDPEDVEKVLKKDTVLVSIMLANAEVGTIQPISEIAKICHNREIPLHTDAVAATGNMPVDVLKLGVDSLSLAANQFYGPKGSGALFIRKGLKIFPLIDGGIQEWGKRAGTEDTAAIAGIGKAAEIASIVMKDRVKQMIRLRDFLIEKVREKIDHVYLTGHPRERLPYHASFCVEFVEGEAMLLHLDMKGISVSSGSACASKSLKASHVLLAMGIEHALAQGSIVFGLIEGTDKKDIEYFLDVFPPIIKKLRNMSPLYTKYLEEKKNDL